MKIRSKWKRNIQGMNKIMETIDNIRIKLFVLAALKEYYFYFSLFFCFFTLCSASVNALQIVYSKSSYERAANGRFDRFLERTDFWCAFS